MHVYCILKQNNEVRIKGRTILIKKDICSSTVFMCLYNMYIHSKVHMRTRISYKAPYKLRKRYCNNYYSLNANRNS